MQFSEEELDVIVEKKVDRIIGFSGKNPIIDVPLERLLYHKINTDPNLQKDLISRVLQNGTAIPMDTPLVKVLHGLINRDPNLKKELLRQLLASES